MIPWRSKWQPTPVCLPGESHGQRSLVGYSPRGCKESDTTEQLVLLLWAQLGLLLLPADAGGGRLCSRGHWRGGSQSKGREGIERTKASHASSEPAKDHTPTMPPHPGIKGQVTLKGTVFVALPAASPLQLPSLHRPWNLPLQIQRATYHRQILCPRVWPFHSLIRLSFIHSFHKDVLVLWVWAKDLRHPSSGS